MIDIDSIKNNEERLLAKQQNTKELIDSIHNLTKENCMFVDFKRCVSTRFLISDFFDNDQYQFLSLGYFTYQKAMKYYKYSFIIAKHKLYKYVYNDWIDYVNHYPDDTTISNLKNGLFHEELFECLNNTLLNDKTFNKDDLVPFDKPCILYARNTGYIYSSDRPYWYPIIGLYIVK